MFPEQCSRGDRDVWISLMRLSQLWYVYQLPGHITERLTDCLYRTKKTSTAVPLLFPYLFSKYANVITQSGLTEPSVGNKHSFKWDYSISFPYQLLRTGAHVAMEDSEMTELFGRRNEEAPDTPERATNLFWVRWRAAALSNHMRCRFPGFYAPSGATFSPSAAEMTKYSYDKQTEILESCRVLMQILN